MAFKSLSQYQEDKNGEFFVLPNDGDSADVVFLYRSVDDVLVADVHYIMSSSYKGYVHCCGTGCPACSYMSPNSKYRGIKLDHKIFIPLYNIQKNKIEFWDRSTFFEQVLQKQVFGPFPNPSETVFKITRHGDAGSRDTKYDIQPIARNSSMPYEKILADFNMTLPDGYSRICREMSVAELAQTLASSGSPSDLEDYGYVPVPRGVAAVPEQPVVSVDTSSLGFSTPPEVAPPSIPEPVVDNAVPDLPDYSTAVSAAAAPLVDSDLSTQIQLPNSPEDSLDDVSF